MKEDICSIHVSDFFEAKDGCPICGMNAELEKRAIDYITGPAMMEPDVRQESNRAGFCGKHLEQMLKRQKRLPVALTLESHLLELKKRLGGGVLGSSLKKPANKANSLAKCFVCERVEWGMERQLATVFRLYEKESDFRELFTRQSLYCLDHFYALLAASQKECSKRYGGELARDLRAVTAAYLEGLCHDVSHYCKMFDYRAQSEDWGNSRDSLERAAAFLNAE